MWENKLTKHQHRGWRAVSATGLHGSGSQTNTFFTDTQITWDNRASPSLSLSLCFALSRTLQGKPADFKLYKPPMLLLWGGMARVSE